MDNTLGKQIVSFMVVPPGMGIWVLAGQIGILIPMDFKRLGIDGVS